MADLTLGAHIFWGSWRDRNRLAPDIVAIGIHSAGANSHRYADQKALRGVCTALGGCV